MNVTRVDPPTAADERATLESFLDFARASVRHKCEGVSESDARRCFGQAPEMSLAGIVSHLRWVEAAWFEVALRGEKNRADDFPGAPEVPLAHLVDEYEMQCERSRQITRKLSLDTAVAEDGVRFSVRWILFHVLEETTRHLGQLDALRGLVDHAANA